MYLLIVKPVQAVDNPDDGSKFRNNITGLSGKDLKIRLVIRLCFPMKPCYQCNNTLIFFTEGQLRFLNHAEGPLMMFCLSLTPADIMQNTAIFQQHPILLGHGMQARIFQLIKKLYGYMGHMQRMGRIRIKAPAIR